MSALTEKANPQKAYNLLWMGIDVGSTTVKVVVVDGETDDILWQDYQRHETKQPEKALEMLKQIAADFPATPAANYRAFITGSGGTPVGKHDETAYRGASSKGDVERLLSSGRYFQSPNVSRYEAVDGEAEIDRSRWKSAAPVDTD